MIELLQLAASPEMPFREGTTRASLKIPFESISRLITLKRYVSHDFPWGIFGAMGRLLVVVLFQSLFEVGGNADAALLGVDLAP